NLIQLFVQASGYARNSVPSGMFSSPIKYSPFRNFRIFSKPACSRAAARIFSAPLVVVGMLLFVSASSVVCVFISLLVLVVDVSNNVFMVFRFLCFGRRRLGYERGGVRSFRDREVVDALRRLCDLRIGTRGDCRQTPQPVLSIILRNEDTFPTFSRTQT